MLDFGRGTREVTVGGGRRFSYFEDESEPQVRHYLPNFPHLATMQDGTPGIRLIVYRDDLEELEDSDPALVAFLSLDVDLSWPSELLDEAAARIRSQEGLQETPVLVPILFDKGTTQLMLLDAQTLSPDATEPVDAAASTGFVTRILGAGSPSLYGDNRAIFQASLGKKGAAALTGSLDGVTPIGVVYSLTFTGLQPAFDIRAHVRWDKVHEHFSSEQSTNLLFYEKQIQDSIDSLIDNRDIELEVTVQGTGAGAMDAERKEVMDSVRQLIFDQFFEATIERETAVGDNTADDVVDTLTHIHRNAFTFGVGYTYRRKSVKIEQLWTLNLDWSVRRAAQRTIYPQAHMHVMLDEWGITADDLVTVIDGSDALWNTVPFEVMATDSWEEDSIFAIRVDVEYDDADTGIVREWSTTLTPDATRATHRDWMDRTSGSAFRYRYEIIFKPEGITGPRERVDSGDGWLEHGGTSLVINPHTLYDKNQHEVAALKSFPFDRWPAVQAVFRYRDDSGFEYLEDALITADNRKLDVRYRVDKDVIGTRDLRLSYHGDNGERVEMDWMPMDSGSWPIADPQPDSLDVQVMVAGRREDILSLTVDLEYVDLAAGIHEHGRLTFTEQTLGTPKVWQVFLDDPTRRRYRYRMTLVTRLEGNFIQTGWISTTAPTLPVGERYARRLTVEVVTGALASGYEAVEVSLRYPHAIDDDHARTFRLADNARAEWQVDLEDAGLRDYEVSIEWMSENGFNRRVEPASHSSTLLVVPGAPPE